MSTCVPNRGECWPDSVICVGEGRVRRGGLGWRKGRRARVEEGKKRVATPSILFFLTSLAHCGMLGEDPGSSVTCVIKSVCVGTEVLWGRQGEFMCPCLEGEGLHITTVGVAEEQQLT